jgi:phage tail protein X
MDSRRTRAGCPFRMPKAASEGRLSFDRLALREQDDARSGAESALVRRSQFLTVAGVLVAGVCAAWPFRQSPSPLAHPPAASIPLELTIRRQDVTLVATPSSGPSPAAELYAASAAQDVPAASSGPTTADRQPRLESLAPPPDLPVAFQPRSTAVEEPPASRRQTSDTAVGTSGAQSAMDRRARPRPYRLRDGDTLENLAERFLGTRERAAEIFEANRDTLARPDLLPVGTTITIPPRSRARDLEPTRQGF